MITIGIIGPSWTNDRIKRSMDMFPNFDPIYQTSNNIYDAPKFTKALIAKCDVLLYSGFIPYSISKKEIPKNLPAHFIPIKGGSLYRSFYKLQKRLNHFHTISIDTLSKYEINRLNQELNESITSIHYDSRLSLAKTEEIISFHETAYKEQDTDCALTGLKVVSEALTEIGIPNEWIVPTEEDIIVTLERALLSTEQRKKLESQIVFGIVHIDNIDQLKRQFTSEQHIQRLYLDVQKSILDYVETLEGYLTALSGNEYMFVTTRGTFERVTQGYKYFPLISDMKQQQVQISVGIGFGVSANEAGSHARMALTQAIDFGGEECFIVKEDRSVIGPIDKEAPLTYPLNITDEELLELTEQTNISPYYLRKVLSLIQRQHIDTFTAQELAASLGVTTRSAHRILLAWLDANIVEIVGIEKQQTKGRPRQVYKMLLTR
ncbi:GGDEF domain-containing protein [Oceanobacillus halotolerans]|uniref:hypothetical protein n=1 Tax=Oceanobacillus halotolerans TaxID=2663380 RepID=UPI0013DB4C4C|nr:hypothetical protein [Oceanobacillus halotolerans]